MLPAALAGFCREAPATLPPTNPSWYAPQIGFKVTRKGGAEPNALRKALAVTWPHLLYYAAFGLGCIYFAMRAAFGAWELWDVSGVLTGCCGPVGCLAGTHTHASSGQLLLVMHGPLIGRRAHRLQPVHKPSLT